jgi:hypothetical protein
VEKVLHSPHYYSPLALTAPGAEKTMTKYGAEGSQKPAANGSGSAELDKISKSHYLEGLEARFVHRCEVDIGSSLACRQFSISLL